MKNLRFVYGKEKSDKEIVALARAVFEHFGRVSAEFFWAQNASPRKIEALMDICGGEVLDQALEGGKGALVLTAHFGNWELMARRLINSGYPLSVVARDSDDPAQTGLVNAIRENAGYRVLRSGDPASQLIKVLTSNELLGILPDQNTVVKPIFIPFFGKLASAAQGVALLALRARCPVIPGFSVRTGDRWRIEILPSVPLPTEGSLADKVYELTCDYTAAIEQQIRKYPEQWLWFHDRWRKRPPEEEAQAAA